MKKEILIVPDVHGRDFWRDVLEYKDVPIIFLGDYVAPYVDYENISNEQSIEMFKEILQFRKDNPDRVTMLLGNHDCSYYIGTKVCNNRVDHENYDEIRKIFWNKDNVFKLTHSITVNGKQFIFSHAGYTYKWILNSEELFMSNNIDMILGDWDYLNRMNDRRSDLLWRNMKDTSHYRGGYDDAGSPIWADFQEHINDNELLTNKIQIFGHSWCKVPIHSKSEYEWYMLDCKEMFYIDEKGVVRFLKDDKEVEITKLKLTN